MEVKMPQQVFEEIEIAKIQYLVDNHRQAMDAEKLKELAQSIRDIGVKQPIKCTVRDGKVILVYGHRRIKASEMAGRKTIPSIFEANMTDEQIAEEQVVENIHREDLSPIDEAHCVQVLAKAGKGLEHAASRLGKSESWCRERLSLLNLDSKIIPFIANGRLPLKHALMISRIGKPEDQLHLAGKALNPGAEYSARSELPKESDRSKNDYLMNLNDLRAEIGNRLRSLDEVKWPLKEQYAGRQACVGCAFNTLTAPSLFEGIVDNYMAKSNCANAECYSAKIETYNKSPEKLAANKKETARRQKEEEERVASGHGKSYEQMKADAEKMKADAEKIKAKFPWSALQKYSIALCKYLTEVNLAIAKHIADHGGKNATGVVLVAKATDDLIYRGVPSMPSFSSAAKGESISNKSLAALWISRFGKEPGREPAVDEWTGAIKYVPLRHEDQKLIKDLEALAAVWQIKLPERPKLSNFKDNAPAKAVKKLPDKGKHPEAAHLKKLQTKRNRKKAVKK